MQLALGRADAKEAFAAQRKNILAALARLEAEMKSDPKMNEHINDFRSETEKLKIKLEIVRPQISGEKAFEVKEQFKR